jgi:CheY-like chemotaxis protein
VKTKNLRASHWDMRVLVAEASDVRRAQLAGLLRRAGHEVVQVRDGREALQALLDAGGPRLALLDWEMPGLDGVDVCRHVREASLAVRPHLILLTGRTDREDAVEGLKAGADDFLAKPPGPGELMARLKVGQRAVETQVELLARSRALEVALARLEAVSAIAAGITLQHAPVGDPVAVVAQQTLAALLPAFEVTSGSTTTRVHGALAIPLRGEWIDLVLEVTGTLTLRLGASNLGTTAELLTDVMSTWLKRTAGALEGGGRMALVTAPGRVLASTAIPDGVAALVGPVRVWTSIQRLSPQTVGFERLTPGQVLLTPLRATSKALEVLRAGTWLTASHLERSKTFFQGDDACSEVTVSAPSPFARAAHG